ncbi:MAG: helix-turn-helix domain-containing protein [Bacteroides sp.]|nr:helix-turn-helix domain-containing protein [Bacillota bacterium]MCM1393913.1 helix-turn-helix domain-containing protein [[Eubacterium] siraeum]MCM1456003.1 helix-turn-helix domain-containing protein [Bacteroides sp.]
MLNLSIFAERLRELMIDNNVDTDALIKITNVNRTSVNRYLAGRCFPSVECLVKIADAFKCTLDFLLGREENNYYTKSKECPPFKNQLKFLLDHFQKTKYQLHKEGHITESAIYYWQNGTHIPRIGDIEKLARYFDCTLDYVVGRE